MQTQISRVSYFRVAQAMIIPVEAVSFEVVEELSESERGADGFGSTGL